jgi:hypothetical protein
MLHNRLQSTLLAFLLIMSVSFFGCDSTGTDSNYGTMTVEMTDAPIDSAEAVNVTIARVEVNNQNDDEGWTVISEPQETYNLLELTNGATTVLGSEELEAGTYNQIRLILAEEGNNIIIDGEEYALTVPSGFQTGIKINIHAEIEPDEEFTLLLDFDASQSVVNAGGSYLLKPVIHASNKAETGSLAGTVNPVEAQSVVYAIADSDTLASTIADTTDGEFKLIGLEEGSYDIYVDPSNDAYQDTTINGVSVRVDETSDLGIINLSQG